MRTVKVSAYHLDKSGHGVFTEEREIEILLIEGVYKTYEEGLWYVCMSQAPHRSFYTTPNEVSRIFDAFFSPPVFHLLEQPEPQLSPVTFPNCKCERCLQAKGE